VAQRGSGPIFPIGFDEDALEADLARLGEGGARALDDARVEIERLGGLPASRLMACQAEGRDGTRLPDCVKTYIPWPDGRFGVVFVAVSHPKRPLGLRAIAFGVRHQPRGSKAASVYEIADRRLNG
jgi:hypothetical protein